MSSWYCKYLQIRAISQEPSNCLGPQPLSSILCPHPLGTTSHSCVRPGKTPPQVAKQMSTGTSLMKGSVVNKGAISCLFHVHKLLIYLQISTIAVDGQNPVNQLGWVESIRVSLLYIFTTSNWTAQDFPSLSWAPKWPAPAEPFLAALTLDAVGCRSSLRSERLEAILGIWT